MKVLIHDIWISPGHDFKGRHGQGRLHHGMTRIDVAVCEAGQGLVGDRYHGRNPGEKTQVTFLSREVIEQLQRSLGLEKLEPSAFRRNILISGIDLNLLIGKTFLLHGVVFEGVEECKPCYWMDEAVGPGAHNFLIGRGGLRCRVLTGGNLRCGPAALEIGSSGAPTFSALRQEGGRTSEVTDALTPERPLQIVVNDQPFSVTLQTPGAERFLVRGLLHDEGGAAGGFLAYAQEEQGPATVVRVQLAEADVPGGARRLASTSSCGLCGKESVSDVWKDLSPVTRTVRIDAARLQRIHEEMRKRQSTFAGTGGSHAAAVASASGELLAVFEDIGRHNAVDKVIGFLLERGRLAEADVLAVSGRVSFEIVQKCTRAGIPVLSAISAPSSLAVESATRWGITLAGFCREDRATFYSGRHRVDRLLS